MSFASGKIAGCVSELTSLLKSTLEPSKELLVQSSNTAHHLVANEIDHLFKEDEKSFVEQIPQSLPLDSVDPFALRNIVASYTVADFTDLGKKIQQLVKIQSLSQVALLFFWTFSFHFGVPLVMAAPACLITSGASKSLFFILSISL